MIFYYFKYAVHDLFLILVIIGNYRRFFKEIEIVCFMYRVQKSGINKLINIDKVKKSFILLHEITLDKCLF